MSDRALPETDGGIAVGRESRPALRISFYYAAFFGTVGVFMPFFPVWMDARGLSAAEIGVVLTAMMWTRAAANPIATRVADRLGERKRLMILLGTGAVATAAAFTGVAGFWPVLAVALAHAALQGPILPLGDNLILMTARARGLDYGRMRVWGSIAFIVTSTAAGALISGRPETVIMLLIVASFCLNWIACLFLPDTKPAAREPQRRPFRTLLGNRMFLLFVATAACNMASHAVLYGYASLHWRAAGHSDMVIGLLWAGGVVSEVILFWVARPIVDRLGIGGMLMLGAAAGLVRWIGTGVTTELWALALLQILHGITFGASHLGAMGFLQQAVPARLSATAQGLYASLGTGVIFGLTTMTSGILYEAFAGGAFLVMALLSLASLLLAILLRRLWRPGTEIT